jgi:hypothetical protein
VHQAVADRIQVPFRDMGNQRVKNISRPIRVWQWTPDAAPQTTRPIEAALHQRVQFATASDGVQIAWASIGQGAPVLKSPSWLNHLEYEWHSPIWRPILAKFAKLCHLVRFDQLETAYRTGTWRPCLKMQWPVTCRQSRPLQGWLDSRSSVSRKAALFPYVMLWSILSR